MVWFETKEMYCLTLLEDQAQNQGVVKARLPPKPIAESCLLSILDSGALQKSFISWLAPASTSMSTSVIMRPYLHFLCLHLAFSTSCRDTSHNELGPT